HEKTNFKFNWGAKSKSDCNQIIANARRQGRLALLEHEGKQLLACHGGPTTPDILATSADEAVQAAETHKGPVALKIVSADILHKSDAGGVTLNLKGKRLIRQAYSQIIKSAHDYNPDAVIEGVLVSPMVRPGVEVIVGTKMDDQFGPIIMYGLGGIMVEILKDISFRVLPISRRSAKNMILETKSAPILNGVRGNSPCDKKALVNLLLMVSELVEAYPDIEEMDLNPVIVHEEGLSIVDARIILKQN
ncbi:MAG: acetate--CoA ligase family protein, partial [Desulfobacteraceae bacterium]